MKLEDIKYSRAGINGTVSIKNGLSYCFSGSDGSCMNIYPANLGGFSEAEGIVKKYRRHDTVDGLSCSSETLSIIPFGVEPNVKRNIEFAANHGKVITDLNMKGGMPVDSISIDNVEITGKIKRVGIIEMVEGLTEIPDIIWHELSDAENLIYDSCEPFLVCLVETESGFVWEVGSGDDLWRWNCGKRYSAGAKFKICGDCSKVEIIRDVYVKSEESEVPQRGLRFKWYFAWSVNDEAPEPKMDDESTFNLSKAMNMPQAGKVMYSRDKFSDVPCFESNPFRKRYRSWLRSLAGKLINREIFVTGVEPHICLSAVHLDRGSKKYLMHWDILNVMDQWLWSNRQLDKSESLVRFYPEGKTAALLPSIYGMKNVFPPEQVDWTE